MLYLKNVNGIVENVLVQISAQNSMLEVVEFKGYNATQKQSQVLHLVEKQIKNALDGAKNCTSGAIRLQYSLGILLFFKINCHN